MLCHGLITDKQGNHMRLQVLWRPGRVAAHGSRSSWTAIWTMETLLASLTGKTCLECCAPKIDCYSAAVIKLTTSPLACHQSLTVAQRSRSICESMLRCFWVT